MEEGYTGLLTLRSQYQIMKVYTISDFEMKNLKFERLFKAIA